MAPPTWRANVQEHGIVAAAVAALLDRQMPHLVRRTREEDREIGVLLEAGTGDRVGDDVLGDRLSVDLGPLFRRMRPGTEYLSVHTHPSDCPPSRTDGSILFLYPSIRLVAVVGVRGTLYLLSRATPGPLPSPDELVAAHRHARTRLDAAHARAVGLGAMSKRSADCWRAHAVWRTVAPSLGLRYTRLARVDGW